MLHTYCLGTYVEAFDRFLFAIYIYCDITELIQTIWHCNHYFICVLDAKTAIDRLHGKEILGKRLMVGFARKEVDGLRPTNLYVGGLPLNYDESKIQVRT